MALDGDNKFEARYHETAEFEQRAHRTHALYDFAHHPQPALHPICDVMSRCFR
jgi:hypothetical protein